jgi:hypothetical protein
MATRVLVRNGVWEDDVRGDPRGVIDAITGMELAALAGSVAGLPDRRADPEADEAGRPMRAVLPRRFHPVGAILLASWVAMATAFVVSLW